MSETGEISELSIHTDDGRTTFQPGESINGTIRWSFPQSPRALELQLLWTTRGKGAVDTQAVDVLRLDQPAATGGHPFQLRLADSPFSFSGRLISVLWALRLTAEPSDAQAQLNIVVSPSGREIDLVPGHRAEATKDASAR